MVTLDLSAPELNLEFTRGDTFAWVIELTDEAGRPFEIPAGYTYELTINQDQNPADATNQVVKLTGTVLTQSGRTKGHVQFSITDANWTTWDGVYSGSTYPVTAYCDLQEVDAASKKRTKGKGTFIVDQDINKG